MDKINTGKYYVIKPNSYTFRLWLWFQHKFEDNIHLQRFAEILAVVDNLGFFAGAFMCYAFMSSF